MENKEEMVMKHEEFIFGTRSVIEAVRDGRSIEKVYIKKGLENELFQELFQLIKEHSVSYQFVPVEKINRITRKNHQGVVALLSTIDFVNIETLMPGIYESGKDPLILILDQITDVRNFGAIIRTAECGGVDCVVLPEKGMARIGSDAVKTSAGALFSMPVCRAKSLGQIIRFLKNSGVKVIAATEKSDTLFTDAKMNVPLAIVMGSEDKGISPSVLQLCDHQVKIPLLGNIGSLNVSVAAGLMIYEAVRQRNHE